MATRMLQRRGTASEWASLNPILGVGEVGVALYGDGSYRIKLGNGILRWNELQWVPNGLATELYVLNAIDGLATETYVSEKVADAVKAGAVNPSGVWDVNNSYNTLDLVYHNGTSWYASEPTNIGDEPGVSEKWIPYASGINEELANSLYWSDNNAPINLALRGMSPNNSALGNTVILSDAISENRKLYLPGNANGDPYLISPTTKIIADSLHLEGDGGGLSLIKVEDETDHLPELFDIRSSCTIRDIQVDGNNLVSKLFDLRPTPSDDLLFEGVIFRNALQPSDNGSPTTGHSAAILIRGLHNSFTARDCKVYDMDATADAGGERPVSRGFAWSLGATHEGTLEGSSRKALIENCIFDGIKNGNYWGNLDIDADGVVWRSHAGRESHLIIKNSYFVDCAKRPVKANQADNLNIDGCVFHCRPSRPYRNLSFQGCSGRVVNCEFLFDDATAFPGQVITVNLVNNEEYTLRDLIIDNNRVVCLSGEPTGVFVGFSNSGPAQGIAITRNHIDVPGGLEYFISSRLDAMGSVSEAQDHGIQDCQILNNYIQKLRAGFFYLDRSGSGTTFQQFTSRGNRIFDNDGFIDERHAYLFTDNLIINFKDGAGDSSIPIIGSSGIHTRATPDLGGQINTAQYIYPGGLTTQGIKYTPNVGPSENIFNGVGTSYSFLVFVTGRRTDATGGGNRHFTDLVILTPLGSGTIMGSSSRNNPATRTYTLSSGNVMLEMSGDRYNVVTQGILISDIPTS